MAGTLFGVVGPSGSGKTTFVERLKEKLETEGGRRVAVLKMDRYYRDLSHLPREERGFKNFDHPDALNMDLFGGHIYDLLEGVAIDVPSYSFEDHTVLPVIEVLDPKNFDVIIVDGVMLFAHRHIAGWFYNNSAYINVDPITCFWRRLRRDPKSRGRTIWSVVRQYWTQVYPGYLDHVRPWKYRARFQVSGGGDNPKALEKVFKHLTRDDSWLSCIA